MRSCQSLTKTSSLSWAASPGKRLRSGRRCWTRSSRSAIPAPRWLPRCWCLGRPAEGRLTEGTSMARVSYIDLRGFIDQVDRLRALRRIDGADPYLEIGGITEVAAALPDCPALLFDRIKGFLSGFRIFTNATTNVQRACLALGIDPMLRPLDALKAWMEIRGSLQLRKPVQVQGADFLENSVVRESVDLSKFPVPHWHREDDGRYIGSGSLVIM